MKCPKCGAEVPSGGRFCPECGTDLRAIEASSGKKKLPVWCIVVMLLLAIAASVLGAKASELQKKLLAESEKCTAVEAEKAALEAEKASLSEKVNSLSTKNKSLEKTIEDNKSLVSSYELIQEYFDSPLSASYKEHNNLYSDRSVIMVEKGETATFPVSMLTYDTAYLSTESDDIALVKWSGGWKGSHCDVSVTGVSPGIEFINFTRKGSDETFCVMVIVVP